MTTLKKTIALSLVGALIGSTVLDSAADARGRHSGGFVRRGGSSQIQRRIGGSIGHRIRQGVQNKGNNGNIGQSIRQRIQNGNKGRIGQSIRQRIQNGNKGKIGQSIRHRVQNGKSLRHGGSLLKTRSGRRRWRVGFFLGHHGWGIGIGQRRYRHYLLFSFLRPVRYYNPYCGGSVGGQGCYDYRNPVLGGGQGNEEGAQLADAAAEAFMRGNFEQALALVDKAVQAMPQNADLHQFRSLVLFAMGKYGEATASAHAALAGGQLWNWETLRGFYPSKDAYEAQYRALQKHTRDNPTDPAPRFLLAYHYLMLGHQEAAATELVAVLQLVPNDELSKAILKSLSESLGKEFKPQKQMAPQPEKKQAIPQPKKPLPPMPLRAGKGEGEQGKGGQEQPKQEQKKPVSMVGTWVASDEKGPVVTLVLKADGKFTWTAKAEQGQDVTISGSYKLESGKLTLSDDKNGNLEGTVTMQGEKKFLLKLTGAPADDPGIVFEKQ